MRLPSPLGVEVIRPPILRAAKPIIDERAIPRLIQRQRLIPNPGPIIQITPTLPHLHEINPLFLRQICLSIVSQRPLLPSQKETPIQDSDIKIKKSQETRHHEAHKP
ncbi:hypothetical protein AMTR_s00025p00057190 [Amborella trichopoda]|uniref:Uncharacterized protein n=1 Tax=Amborella trichopoda TaxID=13333 RepID=W1PWQ1_AMBTC|nr:hypothetical protein AMTR_s00025p00057190 [Amborella trichopoda]